AEHAYGPSLGPTGLTGTSFWAWNETGPEAVAGNGVRGRAQRLRRCPAARGLQWTGRHGPRTALRLRTGHFRNRPGDTAPERHYDPGPDASGTRPRPDLDRASQRPLARSTPRCKPT